MAAAGFAEILRGSEHMNEVSIEQVREIASGAARSEYPEDQELVELMGLASRLKGEGHFSRR